MSHTVTCPECGRTASSAADIADHDCTWCHQWWDVREHPLHFDRLGVAISLGEWAQLVEDDEYKRIDSTMVGEWFVSTVWTGMDGLAGMVRGRPAQIFETAVFGPASWHTWEQRRYATEEQARRGHDEMVQLVKKLEGVDDG